MQVKMFEIRDRMMFFSVVAVLMEATEPTLGKKDIDSYRAERYLLRRAGYAHGSNLVAIGRTEADGLTPFSYDPYSWYNNRTMPVAHRYITEHWFELTSGDVVDVEFVNGETAVPKQTEQNA